MQVISPQTLVSTLTARLAGQSGRPFLLALDGRCGSGKTTLAAQLAEHFPGSVTIHTDDFYLPPSHRVENWEHTPCANMDLERLKSEVLVPARAGQTFQYRAYSCREGKYLPPVSLAPTPLIIVEGSYSHHPNLAPYYDMRVFVTCSPEEQARRLQAREGARYASFAERWIPLEEGYFKLYSIETAADFVLYTDLPSSAKL